MIFMNNSLPSDVDNLANKGMHFMENVLIKYLYPILFWNLSILNDLFTSFDSSTKLIIVFLIMIILLYLLLIFFFVIKSTYKNIHDRSSSCYYILMMIPISILKDIPSFQKLVYY